MVNWEVVMWILMSLAMMLSAVAWREMLKIPVALHPLIDWGFHHFFFLLFIPILFVTLLIGKFW